MPLGMCARRSFPALAASSALLIAAWGCDGGKPEVDTSREEATVKGKVTIGGHPVKKGEVLFDAANYKRKDVTAKSTPIGTDGTYTIKTLVGSNRVTVSSPEMTRGRVANQELDFDVKSGENTFDVSLKKQE